MSIASFPRESRSVPSLPQEMLDYIVEHLRDDRQSLVSCTLAARPSVASSQSHLFRVLRLARKGDQEYSHYKPFFREHLHLISYVQQLVIIGTLDTKTRYNPFDNPAGHFCACVLSDLLTHFPCIDVIALDGVLLECVPSCTTNRNPTLSLVKITYIELTDVYQDSSEGVPQFIRLFGLFTNVPVVRLIDVSLGCDTPIDQTVMGEVAKLPSDWNPQIEELTVAMQEPGACEFFACFLVATKSLNKLLNLEVIFSDWPDFEPTVALIQASKKTLVHVCIDVAPMISDEVHSVDDKEELLPHNIDPSVWRGFGLVACLPIVYYEVTVKSLSYFDNHVWLRTFQTSNQTFARFSISYTGPADEGRTDLYSL